MHMATIKAAQFLTIMAAAAHLLTGCGKTLLPHPHSVTPAQAGVHVGVGTALGQQNVVRAPPWIPAFAGMTALLLGHGDPF